VYMPNASEFLEITRETNPATGEVRIAERPGNKSLSEQMKALRGYKKISLVDVGAFEGDTVLEICERIKKVGVEVSRVYLGFSSEVGSKRISNLYETTILNMFNLYEWIELRDLFGIDGRNIKCKDGGKMFIPYWENLIKWASISEEKEKEVRNLCISYNKKLLCLLEDDGQDISKIGKAIIYGGKR